MDASTNFLPVFTNVNPPADFFADYPYSGNLANMDWYINKAYGDNYYGSNSILSGYESCYTYLINSLQYDTGHVYYTARVAPLLYFNQLNTPGRILLPYGAQLLPQFASCDSLGRPLIDCSCCELGASYLFEAAERVVPVTGDTFLDVQTVGYTQTTKCGITTQNPIVWNLGDNLNHGGTMLNIADGLVRVYTLLNTNVFSSTHYVTVFIDMMMQLDPTQLGSQWFRTDCLAVSSVTGQYRLSPYPCQFSLPVLCQYDYTHYVAQPGMVCDKNGPSTRTAAAAPGVTCQKDLDVTEDVFGSNALAFIVGGHTVFSSLGASDLTDVAYAAALDILLQNFTDAFKIVQAALALFDAQSATLTGGYTNPLQTTDATFGSVMDPSTLWAVECGDVASVQTGDTALRVAKISTSCSDFSSADPSQLLPTPNVFSTTNPLPIACSAYTFRPYDFYQGAMPIYQSMIFPYYVLQSSDPIAGITILSKKPSSYSIFNTFQRQRNAVLPANVSYTFLGSASASGASVVTLTVWVSALDPYGQLRTDRTILGQITLTPVLTSFSFPSVTLTNPTETVGFDVQGAAKGVQVTIGNVLVQTPNSTTTCTTPGAFSSHISRRIKPATAINVPVPDNMCILTEAQRLKRGTASVPLEIGQCSCHPWYSGQACDAPAFITIADPENPHGGGNYGTTGRAMAPDGSLVAVSTLPEERGLYIWNGYALMKAKDPARILFTMLNLITFTFPSVNRVDPNYGLPSYVLATSADGLLLWNSFTTAQSVAYNAQGVLASFLSSDELTKYLAVAITSVLPVFMDLAIADYSTTGTSDF